jgi:GTPase SAR1 family protein
MQKKILVIGNADVGKTSLIKSVFTNEQLEEESQLTVEQISYHHYPSPFENNREITKLNVWDLTVYPTQANQIKSYTDSTDVVVFVYDLTMKNTLDVLLEYAKVIRACDENITNATVSLAPPLRQIMLVGTKADLKENSQVNDDDVEIIKTNIAKTVRVIPTAIHPLTMSAKVPSDSAYNDNDAFKTELLRQIQMTNSNAHHIIDDESDRSYIEFQDYHDRQKTCSLYTCICCFIKYLLIWGLFGCVGAALGAIAGVLAKDDVIAGFHIWDSIGQLSFEQYTTVQRASMIGTAFGLGAGLIIILACLLYCSCRRKKPARGDSYRYIDSNDDIKDDSNSSVSTPRYD